MAVRTVLVRYQVHVHVHVLYSIVRYKFCSPNKTYKNWYFILSKLRAGRIIALMQPQWSGGGAPPQDCQQCRSTRRIVLISKIYAAAALMGNDHILSLRTGDALVQRRAPALG